MSLLRGALLLCLSIAILAQSPPPPPPPAPAMPPEFKAFNIASSIFEPQAKIAALTKFIAENPKSFVVDSARSAIMDTSLKYWPEQRQRVLRTGHELIAGADPAARARVQSMIAGQLMSKGILLNEAEKIARAAVRSYDFAKWRETELAGYKEREQKPPSEEALKQRFDRARAMPLTTLGEIYAKRGKDARAEKTLREAYAINPESSTAAAALGQLALKRKDTTGALEYFTTTALAGRPAAKADFENAYKATHNGSLDGVEGYLDGVYRKKFPLPFHAEPYQPAAGRSKRAVLVEVFTGSGCPPCVAADLGFDGVLERYSRSDVVMMMNHVHIPVSDPLANAATEGRRSALSVNGVPSYFIDGNKNGGGGGREMADGFYKRVTAAIDKALETASAVEIKLDAKLAGTLVDVGASASGLTPEDKDAKLNIVLVEELVRYSGENGVRFHPMVVREATWGLDPATANATFDVAAINQKLAAYFDEYNAKPRRNALRERKSDVDATKLGVVAFLETKDKKILQSAYRSLSKAMVSSAQ